MTGAQRSGSSGPARPPLGAVDPAAARASAGIAPAQASRRDVSAAAPRRGLDPTYQMHPGLTLLSLGLCLVGFLDIAFQLYEFKFNGIGPTIHGLPSRVLFVFGLTLVASPLILAIFRRPPLLFILPTISLVFLLYPLFAPYGVPNGQDAIFNFQFAFSILHTGQWVPGGGVTLQAVVYAYYPASAVFNAELSSFTGVPLYQTFLWGEPLLRLLILPATIYALGKRYFGHRVGLVSVLIFLATPSILFNYPVQSEFAIPFFALTLVLLGYLVIDTRQRQNRILVAAALFASFVIISHHFSSYVLGAWVGSLVVLWAIFRVYSSPNTWRAAAILGSYLAAFFVYTYWVSLPSFLANWTSLVFVVTTLIHPSSLSVSTATSVGASFPEYQLAWSYLAYLTILVISVLVLRRWLRGQRRRYFTPNLIVGILAVLVTLPLLVTAFSFLAERVLEYGEIFMAPAVAWWLTQRLVSRPASATRPLVPVRPNPPARVSRRLAVSMGVIVLVVLIFTGGSLVPYSTRDQFAAPSAITTESPLHIDYNSYALGIWSHEHLTSSTYVWGDTLTLCVFGGFGLFNMVYDQYMLYNGTTIPLSVWSFVSLGSFVVVDKYMTTTIPQFPGPTYDQPTAPLTPGQLAKFNNPAYFDLVYQDSTFTIYEVTAIP